MLATACLAAEAAPGAARADDKTQCISASEQGQQLRDDGKYSRARDAFTACAREVCPAIVRRDCTRWLAGLEELWPTVVFGAKDAAGRDLSAVRVSMDGEPIAASLDGKPVFVDPGAHVFRFEAEGQPPTEQDVVVRASEKGRAVEVQFGTEPAGAPAAAAGSTKPARKSTPGAASESSAEAPFAAWVFAGVALVAFGTEAYFGISGLSDRSVLQAQPCARTATCSPGSVQSIRTKFAVADVALGVGVVSAAVSAYLLLTSRPPAKAERTAVDVTPVPGGAAAVYLARF